MGPHQITVAGDSNQWEEGKGQGDAQYYLGVDNQLFELVFIETDDEADDEDRNQGHEPGQQAPFPQGEADIDVALHDDLPRQGRSNR